MSCVSGVVTKQAFGLWSVDRPAHGFVSLDMTAEVAEEVKSLEVLEDCTGDAIVAGYTVVYGRDQAPKGVVPIDTSAGQRAMATMEDAI